MNPLKGFSDDRLIEELVRRRNNARSVTPEHWCDECRNYVVWSEAKRTGEMPDDFNPCGKGHTMQFIMPIEINDDHGYYRRVCADRDMA